MGGRCERKAFTRAPSTKVDDAPEKVTTDEGPKKHQEGREKQQSKAEHVVGTAQEQQDPNHELRQAAQHLEEMGLGSADVLVELLKTNGGCMQRTIEGLLSGDQA